MKSEGWAREKACKITATTRNKDLIFNVTEALLEAARLARLEALEEAAQICENMFGSLTSWETRKPELNCAKYIRAAIAKGAL